MSQVVKVLQSAVDRPVLASLPKLVWLNCRTFLTRDAVPNKCSVFRSLENKWVLRVAGPTVSIGYTDQRRYVGRTKTRLPYTKPLSFDYSGDLEKLPPLEPTGYQYKFKNVSELESAPDVVKKLVSLDFADSDSRKDHRYRELMSRIDGNLDGEAELEKLIARWTIEIRTMTQHCLQFRKDKRSKSLLVEKIQARKKQLKNLRKLDFERFAWLLNELRIRYVPFPRYYKRLTRRYLRKSAVVKQARQLRGQKMREFRENLEAEKAIFMQEKETVLAEIRNDLQELELDAEEVFREFSKSLEPPKEIAISKNYRRILRKYDEAVASGKIVPKPMMSPRH